jgi:hypothetical protein
MAAGGWPVAAGARGDCQAISCDIALTWSGDIFLRFLLPSAVHQFTKVSVPGDEDRFLTVRSREHVRIIRAWGYLGRLSVPDAFEKEVLVGWLDEQGRPVHRLRTNPRSSWAA